MEETAFNTENGQTIARELLMLYLNVGTYAKPDWKALGSRVEDSSAEYDWGEETSQDILGVTHSEMKKPVVTQSFDPAKLDSGDSAYVQIWNDGIRDQNPQALANKDLLQVHLYAGDAKAPFAERYPQSMVKPSSLGGAGGSSIDMPFDVTFGGKRETGTAALSGDKVTFTPATAA